jgi:hypothetical protein
MIINPLYGIGNITFGMNRKEVQSVTGGPEQVKNQNAKEDDCMPEVWCYDKLGLQLEFDSFYEFRLDRIKITSSDFYIYDKSLIGLPEERLVRLLPKSTLESEYNSYKEYKITDLKLEMILENNIVREVTLEPDSNVEFFMYCSKSLQRRFTCKRILKNNTRRHERKVAAGLYVIQKSLTDSNLELFPSDIEWFPSDIEWFLGNYLSINPGTRELWCDGIELKKLDFVTKNTVWLNANADILSSIDRSAYDVCELQGYITITSTGKKLKNYNLKLKRRENIITINK